jgi:hypothetical protein
VAPGEKAGKHWTSKMFSIHNTSYVLNYIQLGNYVKLKKSPSFLLLPHPQKKNTYKY